MPESTRFQVRAGGTVLSRVVTSGVRPVQVFSDSGLTTPVTLPF